MDGHVYHYLVESIINVGDYDEEMDCEDTVTERPLKKGRMLLKSNFVENVDDNNDNQQYFIRAHVHHSMKNEKPLLVTVVIQQHQWLYKRSFM